MRYLVEVRDDDFIDVLVRATHDENLESIAMTYKERLIERGRQEGRQEVRQEGVEHARSILAKLLELEFGPLDEEATREVNAADLDRLARYSERVLRAESLADAFER